MKEASKGQHDRRKQKMQAGKQHYVTEQDSDEGEERKGSEYLMQVVKDQSCKPLIRTGIPIAMELGTGASVSIMSEQTYRKVTAQTPLQNSEVTLSTYTGGDIPVLGKASVKVDHAGKEQVLAFRWCKGKDQT